MERISQLRDVLNDLIKGKFERTLVSAEYAEIKGKVIIGDPENREQLSKFVLTEHQP
jgi:hypothetical protein